MKMLLGDILGMLKTTSCWVAGKSLSEVETFKLNPE